jgi:predicted CopG family antitoxin|tara:strand:+ start:262 stop:501 length:240 start_codon:yes stop_codon:yes gene_type:complete
MPNSGYYVSILLYSIDKNDKEFFDNRNHYYDIRISFNDEQDSFSDIYEHIYTKKEALKLFNVAKLDADDIYLERRKYDS